MSASADMGVSLPFLKMHGLGNDFVVIDGRVREILPSADFLRAVASRRRGPGCDQIIILREAENKLANLHMAIYNADGSQVGACGNATRCVASLIFAETGKDRGMIETISGLLPVWQDTPGLIAVDFGPPKLDWDQIPLAREADTNFAPVTAGELFAPSCVNVGNPHAVFFVASVADVNLAEIGPRLEHDPIFPERCNIEIAQILDADTIRMRVWERGCGITEACGSGACATLVAAVRRGLTKRRVTVKLDGGDLVIEWREDNHVVMSGPAALSYCGELTDGFDDDANAS
jgi:diaminopimelate epimerase